MCIIFVAHEFGNQENSFCFFFLAFLPTKWSILDALQT
jgi:hypothetical protein